MKAQVNSVLVKSEQAAKILGISYDQLRKIAHSKESPVKPYRLGTAMLWDTSDLDKVKQAIEQQKAKPPKEKIGQFNFWCSVERRDRVRKHAAERGIGIADLMKEMIDKHIPKS